MSRKLLLTHAAGEQESLLDVVGPNYRAYADRHGYEFEPVRGPIDTGGHNRYWSKVALIRERLRHYEVVLWLDCDFAIRRQALDVAAGFYPQDFQALCIGYTPNGLEPNPGLWLVRNVGEAHEFLDLMWATGNIPDADLYMQATLQKLLGFSYLPSFCKPVSPTRFLARTGWLDPRWNCLELFEPDAGLFAHAVHYAGMEFTDKFVGIRHQITRDRLPGWEALEDPGWVELAELPAPERFPHPAPSPL
jgi:hypothetical protein